MTTNATHKFVGDHVQDLADGRTLEPGQTVKLDRDQLADPHNARLINEGQLIELEPARPARHDKKED